MWKTILQIERELRDYTGCASPPTGDLAELQLIVSKLHTALAAQLSGIDVKSHGQGRETKELQMPTRIRRRDIPIPAPEGDYRPIEWGVEKGI